MKIIAHIRSDFSEKFGIPRQSGMVNELVSKIVFTEEYRVPEAIRGLSGFSHIWLIWDFSLAHREGWSPTVRPPRLGGNMRMGVFATRSPYRPNPIGLSCVKIERIEENAEEGPIIYVRGADLLDRTPIYDIKPYIPMSDMKADASAGFSGEYVDYSLAVEYDDGVLDILAPEKREALLKVLSLDPRPSYQDDPERIYGLSFAGYNIRFSVCENTLRITEINIKEDGE